LVLKQLSFKTGIKKRGKCLRRLREGSTRARWYHRIKEI